MAGGDILLRAHGGLPVLARASPCHLRLRVTASVRRIAAPLAAAKVDIADVVSQLRSGSARGAADPKRQRRVAEDGPGFPRVVAGRRRGVREEEGEGEGEGEPLGFDAEKSGGEAGGVDGSYLSETR
jgi:ATP-dependent RNA helicase MSS116